MIIISSVYCCVVQSFMHFFTFIFYAKILILTCREGLSLFWKILRLFKALKSPKWVYKEKCPQKILVAISIIRLFTLRPISQSMDKNSIQYPDSKTQEDIKNVSMDLIGMKKKVDATCIYSGNCFPFLWNDECSFLQDFLQKVGQYAQFFPLDHLLSKEGNFKRKILVQR